VKPIRMNSAIKLDDGRQRLVYRCVGGCRPTLDV
jgi:hypothetical protein